MDEHREGIQTEKPIPLGDHREDIQAEKPKPAWEQPGGFRRDGEPHRGNVLWWLAGSGFLLGSFSLLPWYGWWIGLIGISLNLCIRYLAKADLAKMQVGLMDPAGEENTGDAMSLSTLGLGFSIAGTVVWGGVYFVLCWIKGSPPW